jgi:hypothetical protein
MGGFQFRPDVHQPIELGGNNIGDRLGSVDDDTATSGDSNGALIGRAPTSGPSPQLNGLCPLNRGLGLCF